MFHNAFNRLLQFYFNPMSISSETNRKKGLKSYQMNSFDTVGIIGKAEEICGSCLSIRLQCNVILRVKP